MWKTNNNPNMHNVSDIGPNVPAFLVKLWKLVEDPECEMITWSESGMSFIIVGTAQFAREVLPLHYKHNNMASFIRQLNMYDFHKISSLESGALKHDKDELEFAHQFFVKDHPYLLENIKRKLSNPKAGSLPTENISANGTTRNTSQSDIFSRLLSDVNILKGKQESWDARLSAMKRENEALWRELAVFRQKHMKQEQIINRLIHFIVTIVQPSRKVPIPRRFPLMLNDTHQVRKMSNMNGSVGNPLGHGSPPGPTIHEIEGDVLINGSEIRETTATATATATATGLGNEEFITATFSNSEGNNVEVVITEPQGTKDPVLSSSNPALSKKKNSSDWLELALAEDDGITPLTAVDPTKVNPVVAAATLKHLESNNKITIPVTMKIPSIITADGKKKIPEKKIIYLAEVQPPPEKPAKKRMVKQPNPKNEWNKNKTTIRPKTNAAVSEFGAKVQSAAGNNRASASKIFTVPGKTASSGKRKVSASGTPSVSLIPNKRQNIEGKTMNIEVQPVAEATSEHSSPFPTPNTLENLLKYNLFDLEALDCEDNGGRKDSTAEDTFWRLESLYNGSFAVNDLISNSEIEAENAAGGNIDKTAQGFTGTEREKTPEMDLCNVGTTSMELPKHTDKNVTENGDPLVNFSPKSLAVVCQSSTSGSDELSKELSSHVDSVQGEIDYLKEVLKGEGYNLDINNILGYFNEDPLSYGLLPPTDDEQREREKEKEKEKEKDKEKEMEKEKEHDKGITGNEVITYGTPSNLMELVDLFGSTGTVQDWSNLISPTSPTVSELVTPASSPSPANASISGKRKI